MTAITKTEGSGLPFYEEEMRAIVEKMAAHMLRKIIQNSYKGKPILAVNYCLDRLDEEMDELRSAVGESASSEDVWKEAADVGCFALFTALNYERQRDGTEF